jgi:hypothetical protein
VSTDRERRGEDAVHLAIRTVSGLATASVQFLRGRLTRQQEGELSDLLGLNALLWSAGIEQVPIAETEAPDSAPMPIRSEQLSPAGTVSPSPVISPLSAATALPALIGADGNSADPSQLSPDAHIIFPGSFNPLHYGHDLCAQAVEAMTGKQVVFELAAANADKPGIDRDALAARALQFRGRWPVLISSGLPLFLDKARAYGGFGFIAGLDTGVRLFDSKYFGGDAGRDAAIAELRSLGATFYVCGRGDDPLALAAFTSDPRFAGLLIPVPGRYPISSSDIRRSSGIV